MLTLLALITLAWAASTTYLVRKNRKRPAQKGGGWFGWLTMAGCDRKVFIAPWGGVYLNNADALLCFGEQANLLKTSGSGKSRLIGFAKRTNRGTWALEFSRQLSSEWVDEFRLIRTEEERLSLLTQIQELTLPCELAAPDEGETSDGNAADTLEEELLRALRFTPQGGSKLDALGRRTAADRLRDGE